MQRRGAIGLIVLFLLAFGSASPARASSAIDISPTPASTAPACTGWTSTYVPPAAIRVGMVNAGGVVTSVATVPFLTYVEKVLAAEWPSSNADYLQIGAMAVKQFAWYWSMHGRAVDKLGTQCYDVRSDTNDQLFNPSKVPTAAEVNAVMATWSISLRQGGVFFRPLYNGYNQLNDTGHTCGTGTFTTRTFLPQQAVAACLAAPYHWTRNQVLHFYFDYPSTAAPSKPLSIADLLNLAGGDRYATAVAVSAWRFATPGVPVVYVATGANFPDALAAGPAAGKAGGPVLIVPPGDSLPPAIAAELARLQPATIKVLGGPGAVSDALEAALVQYAPGADATKVTRIAGTDRYATALAVARDAFPPPAGQPPDAPPADPVAVVYLATGANFPDALAGAAAAARQGGLVLLVDPAHSLAEQTGLTAELTRLQPARIRVLGGPTTVSDEVLAGLADFSADVARISGSTRYDTAAALSAAVYTPGEPFLYLATGANFPDALAAAPLGGPLLLVPSAGNVPFSVLYEIGRLASPKQVILGSGGAVPDGVVGQAAGAQEVPPSPSPSPAPTPTPSPSAGP
ncbi:MAG: cell wall-binding repeat-containing protein [Candidatus Limnocylindrales bacterium]